MARKEQITRRKKFENSPEKAAPLQGGTSEVIAQLLRSPEGRRALSSQSPSFFDTFYCGMRHAPHRENWLQLFEGCVKTAKARERKQKLLLLAPRDHGKTEACVTLAARLICLDRNIKILWICESEGQAKKRIRRVKSILNSQKVKDDWCSAPEQGFGHWIVSGEDKWSDKEVYVNRTKASVDPTLEAVGSGGSVTGGHFDVIICDDLEDDSTVYTSAVRRKTRDWFGGTVQPMLLKTGAMVVVGTRKHHDDLYGHMIEDPTYQVVLDQAFPDGIPTEFTYDMENVRGKDTAKGCTFYFDKTFCEEQEKTETEKADGPLQRIMAKAWGGKKGDKRIPIPEGHELYPRCLWPERPADYLMLERLSQGPLLFSREFQNDVQDDSASAFKWADLQAAKQRGRNLSFYEVPDAKGLDIVQGWDFALVQDAAAAEARDTDYTVGMTWAKDINGHRYLMGLKRARGITVSRLQSSVEAEYHHLCAMLRTYRAQGRECPENPRVVSVERNNFGEIHFVGLQRSTDLPLKPHTTTKNKADPWEGVPSLSALFENGKVTLPSKTPEDEALSDILIKELWGLGRERHDDCVMALWIAEVQLRKAGFTHVISFGDGEGQTLAAEADERMAPGDLLDDANVPEDEIGAGGARRPARDPDAAPGLWGSLGLDLDGDW